MKVLKEIGSFVVDRVIWEGEIMKKAGCSPYGFFGNLYYWYIAIISETMSKEKITLGHGFVFLSDCYAWSHN